MARCQNKAFPASPVPTFRLSSLSHEYGLAQYERNFLHSSGAGEIQLPIFLRQRRLRSRIAVLYDGRSTLRPIS